MTTRPAKHSYEFGPFLLDPAEHLLLRDGEPVPLRPKEFAVLLALVENPGRVLTKDELLKRVWPGRFVEEGNLNRHISTLRGVLGETPGEPLYVETVPRVGYRFVARVEEVRDRSADLVIERHTVAPVVTEEEEAAADGRGGPGPAPAPPALTARGGTDGGARRRLALGAAVLLVGLALAFTRPWDSHEPPGARAAAPVRSLAVLPLKPIGAGTRTSTSGWGWPTPSSPS